MIYLVLIALGLTLGFAGGIAREVIDKRERDARKRERDARQRGKAT